ncbi:MAG TPA: hypothetical protein VF792_00105 [Ktedonobacterales bacterium]
MSDERPILVHYGPSETSISQVSSLDTPTLRVPRVRASQPSVTKSASTVSWRDVRKQAFIAWIWTRLLLIAFTFATAFYEYTRGHHASLSSAAGLLELWYRFDTSAYLHMVYYGYATLYQAAFFPLYPLMIYLLTRVFGMGAALLIGLIISNLGTLVAFIGLVRLVVDEGGDLKASRFALLALAAYPMAFFLGAAYTEGPFIAAAVWCLWSMRRGRWYIAAGCALFAALVRPTGMILFAPLLYEFARQHDWGRRWRGAILQACAVTLAGPVGVGAYSLYCAVHYHDPLAWIHSESKAWGRVSMPIWQALHDTLTYIVSLRPLSAAQDKKLVDYFAILFVVVMTVALARRQPLSFTLYLAGLLYLTLDSPFVVSASHHYAVYLSASRYMLPSIPVFIGLGRWGARAPALAWACAIAAFAVQAVFAIYFLHGGWVA